MGDIRVLQKPGIEGDIVVELERLLEDAKAGRITGVFIFTESNGEMTHSRVGLPDASCVFWLEIVKRRIIDSY